MMIMGKKCKKWKQEYKVEEIKIKWVKKSDIRMHSKMSKNNYKKNILRLCE